jgi:hypothetical protein
MIDLFGWILVNPPSLQHFRQCGAHAIIDAGCRSFPQKRTTVEVHFGLAVDWTDWPCFYGT